jgi:hypothetical protein
MTWKYACKVFQALDSTFSNSMRTKKKSPENIIIITGDFQVKHFYIGNVYALLILGWVRPVHMFINFCNRRCLEKLYCEKLSFMMNTYLVLLYGTDSVQLCY